MNLVTAALDVLTGFYGNQYDLSKDGQILIDAKPNDPTHVDFWQHYIVDIIDHDGSKGYKDCWPEIFITMMQLTK